MGVYYFTPSWHDNDIGWTTSAQACGAAGVLFARRLELVIDEHAWLAEPKLACCAGRPACPHFAYKTLNNKDTLHIRHYIIRTLCI